MYGFDRVKKDTSVHFYDNWFLNMAIFNVDGPRLSTPTLSKLNLERRRHTVQP